MMTKEIKGPTPNGGVRSVAIYLDTQGRIVDGPEQAETVEIVEYDSDDQAIARTYGRLEGVKGEPIPSTGLAADIVDEDADQTKGTWDMVRMDENGMIQPVDTFAELSQVMELSLLPLSAARETVANLLVLPAWDSAPARLKREVSDWLVATRPK